MDNRYIHSFIQVAELMSFSKAAQQLGYAQSTITAQIQQLEIELKVRLFDRLGKKIYLSPQGKSFLPIAKEIIKLELDAKHIVLTSQIPKGLLRVGILESLCSTLYEEIIEDYLRKYPAVELVIKIGTTLENIRMLKENEVDLIVTLDNQIYDQNLITALERQEKIVFICAPENALTKQNKPIFLQDLLPQRFILTEKYCNYRKIFEEILDQHQYVIFSSLEIGNTNFILNYVAKDLGITLLPYFTVKKILSPEGFHILEVQDCTITMYTQLLYRKDKWISPAQEAFLALSRHYLLL